MSTQLLLGIYGAVLSTILAVFTIAKFLRERPKISVEAKPVSMTASEGQDTHGVLVQVQHGDDVLWEEADVEICVRNSGAQACQISDVFVETADVIHQVTPEGLPVVLDPNTSYRVRVQPEYFVPKKITSEGGLANIPIEAVGVLDGLGKKHRLSNDNLKRLIDKCRVLPVRTSIYKHKETGNLIVAFRVKDACSIVSKD